MLKIRMQRIGRINMPSYRLIVVEHTESTKTGNFTDIVGTYNPRSKERKLDEAKIQRWISVGAQPSATVHNMLISAGILKGKKINVLPKYVEPAKEEAAAETAPTQATAEVTAPVAEDVKEEVKEVSAETPAQ
jgi:small subunit ribosomal protein S16